MTEKNCDKIVRREQLRLPGGIALPVTIVKETYRFYEEQTTERRAEEAEVLAKMMLGPYLRGEMEEGSVEREGYTTISWEGNYLTELDAECHEEIGVFVELQRESPS